MSKRKVLRQLRQIVKDSKDDSCHIQGNALYLYDYREKNIDFDYCELCVINDKLVFIDTCGYQENASETDLQILIDIVEKCTQSK